MTQEVILLLNELLDSVGPTHRALSALSAPLLTAHATAGLD